jgi:hypothetical protein
MEGTLIIELLEGAFLDIAELDELLLDVGHENRLLASLRVFVFDDCLCHEVVNVVLLF